MDPVVSSAIYTAAISEATRSIFTDRGPIAKPALVLQSGSNALLQTYNEVTLPGATLTIGLIGKTVRLTGSLNGGSFKIASIISTTRARVANASFTLPDATLLTWSILDLRDGQIADDPADVTVRINGTPVVPQAVIGLLGQIVLPSAPNPTDDVKVTYSWVNNPVVEMRRLNSKEFRLNSWNRDGGFIHDATQHKYRYNNVLIRPSDYNDSSLSAPLNQPLLRDLKYRAYERAYTPVLNDPSLLLLNSPTHKIAFPPAKRTLTESFVNYEGIGMPESDVAPWDRRGTGTATSSGGKLTVLDDTSGPYPTGKPLFWVRPIDLTFPHIFAMSWRFLLTAPTQPDGVFTGVAAGFSFEGGVLVVGYLLDGGVRKFGILKRGFGDDPSQISAWTGGIDTNGNPTDAASNLDWSVQHSFRVLQDQSGSIRVYLDGDVVETLRATAAELPFLEELSGPFDTIQGAFFGAVSRPAKSTSTWDFVRYLISPTNPYQVSPSSFVNYEANVLPETDPKPWSLIGFHGNSTILSSDTLLLDSTSATDQATESDMGLTEGDFRGYARIEPLLTISSQIVLDAELQLRSQTFGLSPYGLMMAVDDGSYLMQLSLVTDRAVPKFSYGGRSFPEDFAPYFWQAAGGATATMAGRILHINDSLVGDGKTYFIDDSAVIGSDSRVASASTDYLLEFRCRVVSYTVDGSGYAGVFAQVYDSARSVGMLLQEVTGTKYVAFHSDGTTLGTSARFAFNWGDGEYHTYRYAKNTSGDLVILYIDGVFVGSFAYSSFTAPPADPVGQISFGSATPASSGSLSVVDWAYANAWRRRSDLRNYVGLWKGTTSDSLLDYHLPLKVSGKNAPAVGNAMGDSTADFFAANVLVGDQLLVDVGPNKGVYSVAGVSSSTSLTIVGTWPTQPSLVDYRIAKETDLSVLHKYRLVRDTVGDVSVILDTAPVPIIRVGYNSIDLPVSGVGIVRTLTNGLPAIVFGSFDAENLSQSAWSYVRYGILKNGSGLDIVPHHQVLNQWNVMGSPERLTTNLPHTLTSFKSSSTGIVPKKDPDFLKDAGLNAFTMLNQDTPLVPLTQSFEVRSPFPTRTFVSALNRPSDVLNNSGNFSLNDGTLRYELILPKDVLYSSLDVIERTTGDLGLLAPFTDESQPTITDLTYVKEVCLSYDGSVLPENDTSAPTRWHLASDDPSQVVASASAGILTYGTGVTGTKTVYKNNSPLPDSPSLENEVQFRIRVLSDTTNGTGDTQIKFGLSCPGLTVALSFVTTALGDRFIFVLDINNGRVLGSLTFDFLDGNYHTYRIVRDPGAGEIRVFVDS